MVVVDMGVIRIKNNVLLIVFLFAIIFLSGCFFETNCKNLEGKQIFDSYTQTSCGDKSFGVDIDYVKYENENCEFDIVVAPKIFKSTDVKKEVIFKHCNFPKEGIDYENLTSEDIRNKCDVGWLSLEENTKFIDLPEGCNENYGDDCCKEACKLVQNNDVRQDDYARCEIKEPTTGNYETLDFETTDNGKQFSAFQSRFACGNEGN